MEKKPNFKRAAIELSINTLVVIIISLVVLASGITLLYKFIGGAEDIKSQLDEKTQQELERLLTDQGKQVALPLHTATLYPGQDHVFGIGFRNVDKVPHEFKLSVSLSKYVTTEGTIEASVTSDAVQSWLLYDSGPFSLAPDEHHQEGIYTTLPDEARKGEYIFNAQVLADDQPYGNVQKFTVTVK